MSNFTRPHEILQHLVQDGCGPANLILGHAKSLELSIEREVGASSSEPLLDFIGVVATINPDRFDKDAAIAIKELACNLLTSRKEGLREMTAEADARAGNVVHHPQDILAHLVHDGCGPAPKILGHARTLQASIDNMIQETILASQKEAHEAVFEDLDEVPFDEGALEVAHQMLETNGAMEDGIQLLPAIRLLGHSLKHYRGGVLACQRLLDNTPSMPFNASALEGRIIKIRGQINDTEQLLRRIKKALDNGTKSEHPYNVEQYVHDIRGLIDAWEDTYAKATREMFHNPEGGFERLSVRMRIAWNQVAMWLSAALDDGKVCDAMKRDIRVAMAVFHADNRTGQDAKARSFVAAYSAGPKALEAAIKGVDKEEAEKMVARFNHAVKEQSYRPLQTLKELCDTIASKFLRHEKQAMEGHLGWVPQEHLSELLYASFRHYDTLLSGPLQKKLAELHQLVKIRTELEEATKRTSIEQEDTVENLWDILNHDAPDDASLAAWRAEQEACGVVFSQPSADDPLSQIPVFACSTCKDEGYIKDPSEPAVVINCPDCEGEVAREKAESEMIDDLSERVVDKIDSSKDCPDCGGSGELSNEICPTCKGTTMVPKVDLTKIPVVESGTVECPRCHGEGYFKSRSVAAPCQKCNGKGRVPA